MIYTGLTDERNNWRRQLISGGLLDIYVLQQYRINRNSDLWRSTREVEKLCEYVLFLEGANFMSEQFIVKCDICGEDISSADNHSQYRIRLSEEKRQIIFPEPGNLPELDNPSYNFCNLDHLKQWLSKK